MVTGKRIEFRLQVIMEGEDALGVPLGYETLASALRSLPDTEESRILFEKASRHSSALVREAVASRGRRVLSEETCERLSHDPSGEVLHALLNDIEFAGDATFEFLASAIGKHRYLDDRISWVTEFPRVSAFELASLMASHPDPGIARLVARNPNAPIRVLRALTAHPDPAVSAEAQDSLPKAYKTR